MQDIAECLTTLFLKHCQRNTLLIPRITPPGEFRNSWVILSVEPMEMRWFTSTCDISNYKYLVIAFFTSWQNGLTVLRKLQWRRIMRYILGMGYGDNRNQVSFCILICLQLYYRHEHFTTLVSVEIKAKTFNGSAFVLLGTGLGSEGRSLWVKACSCL